MNNNSLIKYTMEISRVEGESYSVVLRLVVYMTFLFAKSTEKAQISMVLKW